MITAVLLQTMEKIHNKSIKKIIIEMQINGVSKGFVILKVETRKKLLNLRIFY